mgnify:CR=1 FL=1
MLAHKATYEGKLAAEVIVGHNVAFDARTIPSVAYTDPEIAWMGLTEKEAIKIRTEKMPQLTYQKKREAEYPPMADYLDGIVKGDTAQVKAYIAACLAVKAKYPKP